jgi:hypothetical protein
MRLSRFSPFVLALLLPAATAAQQNSIQATPDLQPPTAISSNIPTSAKPAPDPLLDVPALPKGQVSLVGGNVRKIDRIRQHLVVEAFGGKEMKISFDERTHIYRDGAETTMLGIHKGDRVYVDTMLDRNGVFAKNIRVETQGALTEAHGQIVSFDPENGRMSLRDELSTKALSVNVGSGVRVLRDGKTASASDLRPGSLVTVQFVNGKNGNQVREITVLAVPGSAFVFEGKVAYLDLSSGLLAIRSQADDHTYDINFRREIASANLGVGSDVTINAVFDGKGYTARTIHVNASQ